MKFQINQIEIDKTQVLKFLGYGRKQPTQIINKKVDEEINMAANLLEPQVFLKSFKITKINNEEIEFGDNLRIKSNYVVEKLKNTVCFYVCLYSIGEKIEKKICEYSRSSETIRALILDKIGVVALDNINYQLRKKILEKVNPLKISSQIFAYEKDFEISNQKWMLDIFENENDAISISKYYQFSPLKTVAVIFGIGQLEEKEDRCSDCKSKSICFGGNEKK